MHCLEERQQQAKDCWGEAHPVNNPQVHAEAGWRVREGRLPAGLQSSPDPAGCPRTQYSTRVVCWPPKARLSRGECLHLTLPQDRNKEIRGKKNTRFFPCLTLTPSHGTFLPVPTPGLGDVMFGHHPLVLLDQPGAARGPRPVPLPVSLSQLLGTHICCVQIARVQAHSR